MRNGQQCGGVDVAKCWTLVMNKCEGLELWSEDFWEVCFTMITSNDVQENNKLSHIVVFFVCIWMNKSLVMHNCLLVVFFMCIWWLGSSSVRCHCPCDHSHSTLWIELLTICNHDKFNNKLVWFLILVNKEFDIWWFSSFLCFECSIKLKFRLQYVDAWTQNSLWFPLCVFHVSSSFCRQQNQRFTYCRFQGLKVMEETMFFDHEPCLVGEGGEIGDTFEL